MTTLAAPTPTASLGTTAPSALAGQDTRETLTTSSGDANSNPAVRTHAVQTPSAPHVDAVPFASAQSDTQVRDSKRQPLSKVVIRHKTKAGGVHYNFGAMEKVYF